MKLKELIFGIVCAAPFILNGCGKGSDSKQAQADNPSPKAAGAPSVKLSSGQLGSIKIGSAQTYSFPITRQAIGSVSFAEDPTIVQSESTLLAAAATYDLDRKELARVKSLGDANGIAQKELEQATSDEQTAAAALKAARDALRALGKSDAQINKIVSAGQIEPSSPQRRGTKWIIANAVESDSALLHTGQPAEASILAIPNRTFKGSITEIYAVVDPNSHRQTIRIEVSDPKDELRPGMLADVTIQVQKPEISIGVPQNGVVRKGDGTMTVWVTTDRNNFVQNTVQTGLREDDRVQILQGLQQGELVVTDGAIFLDNLLEAPPSD